MNVSDRPTPPDLRRISDAMLRISSLLEQQPRILRLAQCLPAIAPTEPDRPLRSRAALASALVAGLELTRDGRLTLSQTKPFGSITLHSTLA